MQIHENQFPSILTNRRQSPDHSIAKLFPTDVPKNNPLSLPSTRPQQQAGIERSSNTFLATRPSPAHLYTKTHNWKAHSSEHKSGSCDREMLPHSSSGSPMRKSKATTFIGPASPPRKTRHTDDATTAGARYGVQQQKIHSPGDLHGLRARRSFRNSVFAPASAIRPVAFRICAIIAARARPCVSRESRGLFWFGRGRWFCGLCAKGFYARRVKIGRD